MGDASKRKGKTLKKYFVLVIVFAILVTGGVYGWRTWAKSADPTKDSAQELETAVVKKGPLRQTVDCTGRVVAKLEVDIKCRASGQVVACPVDISDTVKKGDLLLALDPIDQERQEEQAKATVQAAEARLEQSKIALAYAVKNLSADKQKSLANVEAAKAKTKDAAAKAEREQQLLDKKFSSQEGLQTAQTSAVQAEQDFKSAQANLETLAATEINLTARQQDIKLYEAQLTSSKIALNLAKLQLSYCTLSSPIDGVVSACPVKVGTIISSGISNVGGGTTVMTLSDLSQVFIYGSVDESKIGDVVVGQKAEITADAFPRKRFKGEVMRIATKGVNLSNVVTFEVRIEVTSENKTLMKPEMTGNISIVVADKAETLTIPANCVTRSRKGTFVTLKKPDGTLEKDHAVEIGISDGSLTEILSGLAEGDTVVMAQADAESKWRTSGDARDQARQRAMMMRTMGGGGGGGGGRGGGR